MSGGDVNRGLIKDGRIHLAGHKTIPDQLIKPELVIAQVGFNVLGFVGHGGRPDRFMGILGRASVFEDSGLGGQIVRIIILPDIRSGFLEGLVGNAKGIGAHVGNQPHGTLWAQFDSFIEFLRHAHGFLGGEAQFSGGFLLEFAGRKRRRGRAFRLLLLYSDNHKGCGFQFLHETGRLGFCADFGLFLVDFNEARLEGWRIRALQRGRNVPVFFRDKFTDFVLAITDHADCDGLDASGAQPSSDLFPEEGADLISYQPIQYPAGLLGLIFIKIQFLGMVDGFQDCVFRQVIEKDAIDFLVFCADFLGNMPRDRFTLSVRVGSQKDVRDIFCRLLQFGQGFLFGFDHLVSG